MSFPKAALMTALHHSNPSTPINPFCWHQCYWELFTAHTLPCINPVFGKPAFFLDSWFFKIGPLGCHKKSVRNYHYLLYNYREERSSHLLHGRSLKSRTWRIITIWTQQSLLPIITMLDLINNEQNRLSIEYTSIPTDGISHWSTCGEGQLWHLQSLLYKVKFERFWFSARGWQFAKGWGKSFNHIK
jgi:hypothetical protein